MKKGYKIGVGAEINRPDSLFVLSLLLVKRLLRPATLGASPIAVKLRKIRFALSRKKSVLLGFILVATQATNVDQHIRLSFDHRF